MAKTVPRNWPGRRAQKPARISQLGQRGRPPLHPRHTIPPVVAHQDIPRADFTRWVVLVSACERSLSVVSPYPIEVSRAPLTSFRRLADHPGLGRAVRLGIHGHPSISSPISSAQRDAPVAPTVVGRLSHVDLDGGGRGPFARPYGLRHPTRPRSGSIRRASFERLNPGRLAASWRPNCDSQIFFPIFSSREGAMGPGNSKCVLGSQLRASRSGVRRYHRIQRHLTGSFFVVIFPPVRRPAAHKPQHSRYTVIPQRFGIHQP
jgi:hypothetical protein